METVITRDTDVLREYLVALDARERGLSPFARLAATVKLARLRRELTDAQLETTDDDLIALRREVDERLNRTWLRRSLSGSWGARAAVFLMLVIGQQLVLGLVLLATMLFVQFVPKPGWWNTVLPHDEPVFLYVFVFFFFFATPMVALAVLFGGRYFRSWQRTLPATLIIIALSALGTFLSFPDKKKLVNPVQRSTSISQFAKERGLTAKSYEDWVKANWLMNDPKFQRDYERYLRNGPGRSITSGLKDDAAWRESLPVMGEYVDSGQDPNSFREWLKYYLERNRIYSEDRVDQEVTAIMGEANQRYLGIWQVAPFLKERDERTYRAYLGEINTNMKKWGLISLALFTIIFLVIYLTGPALSFWERMAGAMRIHVKRSAVDPFEAEGRDLRNVPPRRVSQLRERYYSFPERREITTPPFFDTPFKLLSRVHRSFVRLVIFTSILVFLFWGAIYTIDLASGRENAPSQIALMRSHLLFGGSLDEAASRNDAMAQATGDATVTSFSYASLNDLPPSALEMRDAQGNLLPRREAMLAARISELEQRLDDTEYDNTKKLKQQEEIVATQRAELDYLKGLSSQLQQSTAAVPDQLAELSSRTSAAEARAGQVLGEASAAKQQAEGVEKQLAAKLSEVENRAARAVEQVGKVEDQASVLATRTEALEKELDRRARQVEARTEELGARTAEQKEREEQISRFQRVTLTAILSSIRADVEDLDRRVDSAFYRLFSKGEARRDVDSLRERITKLAGELRQMGGDQAAEMSGQLDELGKHLDQIAARIK